ncbi:MAG: Integral rane sensor signal transduction histidine kinase [Verrucomicrobiales bacterium]|nr:Integral rane sensor signal transduction histidine kinase [Verrucomicrobiales bacterium]
MNTRSLRFQLSAWYALLFTTVFLCFGLFICAAVKHFLHNNLRNTLVRRSHQMDDLLGSLGPKSDPRELAKEVTLVFAPETSGRFIRVADISAHDPKVLYISSTPKEATFDPADITSVSPISHEAARVETLPDGRQIMINSLPSMHDNIKYLIEVGSSLSPINAVLHQVNVALTAAGPMVILLAIFGAYLLVGRALTPVVSLARSAERITLQNLDERLPVSSSGDEIETLATALNKMISRLRESFDYTRRFIADASHELRTPLTVMRAELETILRTEATSPTVQDSVASTLEEVDRLAVIVEGLLSLSLLDAGGAQNETVVLDLSKLASGVTEQMGLVAEDKGITLKPECISPVLVEGDRSRLKQVLVNLLDNAIKYTPAGGKVIVRTRSMGDRAVLEVIDTGIGIPAKDLPHVFERFFRVDKARSRDVAGAGLGLSIVKSICAAHDGVVEAESTTGQGSCFRISLPLGPGIPRKTNERSELSCVE